MTDSERTGRMIGVLLLLQLVGLMVGFILLDALRTTDYLTSAAANSARIKAGVIVLLANGALTIGISIKAWQFFSEHSARMGLWLILLSVIMLVMQAVDSVHIMSMIALSQEQANGMAGITDALATSMRVTRRYAHYLELFAIDFWLMMFYAILFRFALVSRIVAGFSLTTVLLQFFSVPVPGFLGYSLSPNLAIPLAFGLLATAAWLVVRGFVERGPESGQQSHLAAEDTDPPVVS
jgi:hypothetical protein